MSCPRSFGHVGWGHPPPHTHTHTHCLPARPPPHPPTARPFPPLPDRIPEAEVMSLAKELRARGLDDVATAVEDEAHREALQRRQGV